MLHTITTHTTSYRWDADADGDPHEFPTELGVESDVETLYVDDENPTFVDAAVDYFRRMIVEPSSSPGFRPGVWYTETDPYEHPYTGVVEERTFHLTGFTVDEQREVWERVIS